MASYANLPGERPPPNTFLLELWTEDVLRLYNAPDRVHQIIKAVILQFYSPGIQKEKSDLSGCVSFKLNGYPFAFSKPVFTRRDDSRLFVHTFCNLLQNLSVVGFHLETSANLNTSNTLSTLFFRRSTAPSHKEFMAVSFFLSNRIQLMGCPDDVFCAVLSSCRRMWRPGVCNADGECFSDAGSPGECYEIKLGKSPWDTSSKNDSTDCALLLLDLMSTLGSLGYRQEGVVHFANNAQQTILLSKVSRSSSRRPLVASADLSHNGGIKSWPLSFYRHFSPNKNGFKCSPRYSTLKEGSWGAHCASASSSSLSSCVNPQPKACVLNLSRQNRLEMVLAPRDVQELVADVVRNCYPPSSSTPAFSIQSDKEVNAAARVLKVSNKPWTCPQSPESVLLVNTLLNTLWNRLGWQVSQAVDISRTGHANTCMLTFHQRLHWTQTQIACLLFHMSSKLVKNKFFISAFNISARDFRVMDQRLCNQFKVKRSEVVNEPAAEQDDPPPAAEPSKSALFAHTNTGQSVYRWEFETDVWTTPVTQCSEKRYCQVRQLQQFLLHQLHHLHFSPLISSSLLSGHSKLDRSHQPPYVHVMFFTRDRADQSSNGAAAGCSSNSSPSKRSASCQNFVDTLKSK